MSRTRLVGPQLRWREHVNLQLKVCYGGIRRARSVPGEFCSGGVPHTAMTYLLHATFLAVPIWHWFTLVAKRREFSDSGTESSSGDTLINIRLYMGSSVC